MAKDILSSILDEVRLDGGVYFGCEFGSPWGMAIAEQEVAEFHVVVRGNCWLHVPWEAAPIPLQAGDLLAFPHGDPHVLSDTRDPTQAAPAEALLAGQDLQGYGPLVLGGEGPKVQLLCGYFHFDAGQPHPFVQALPRLLHVKGTDDSNLAWVQNTLHFMCHETRMPSAGTDALLKGLVKVLFVQMVRAYMEGQASTAGLLAAIADRYIGKALQLMHEHPETGWTLDSLARQVGMSRSAFSGRFHALTASTVLNYLTELRMQRACSLLEESGLGLALVAERTGYQSEAAFSKAFKKARGLSPGAWRRQARPAALRQD